MNYFFKKLNNERSLIAPKVKDLLKSAIILGKLFEENGIKDIGENLKIHLELKFAIDSVNNQTEIIEFSQQSYQKSFQSLLSLELKNAIARGTKDANNLLRIVDNNIQEMKPLTEINFKEIY